VTAVKRVGIAAVGVLALVALLAPLGCTRKGDDDGGKVTLLVSEKVIPTGKLVQSAVNDGSIKSTSVPSDIAPGDRVVNSDDIKCLVPSANIPAGSLLRRSMFVEPQKLGLDKGLTDQTAKPTSCD
jgi:hypothetical protein